MAARPLRKLVGRGRMEEHIDRFREFLYEEGPHTADEMSEHFGVSPGWARDILTMMKECGEVSTFTRGRPNGGRTQYWMLTSP